MQFHPSYHVDGASPLSLDVGFLFCFVLVESNILLWMVVQQQVVILEFLQKVSVRPFLPSCRIYAYEYMTSLFIQLSMCIWVTSRSQLL